jgi:hypothetical protein
MQLFLVAHKNQTKNFHQKTDTNPFQAESVVEEVEIESSLPL